MNEALARDRDLTLKIQSQLEDMRRYKESSNLQQLLFFVEELLGKHHILMAILQSLFSDDVSGVMGISSDFISPSVHAALIFEANANNNNEDKDGGSGEEAEDRPQHEDLENIRINVLPDDELDHLQANSPESSGAAGATAVQPMSETSSSSSQDDSPSASSTVIATAAGAAAVGAVASTVTKAVAKKSSTGSEPDEKGLKYSPIGPDMFLETGKVVGQNSTRLAGQVIVGVSAAFLVWDAIDLGWTVTDLIRKKGSQAGKILRDKADELEEALNHTMENYSVEMFRDD